MINQVVANPDYTATSNQYGFYALPKTMKPKTKYRDQNDQQDDESNKDNALITLNEQPQDQKKLQRDYYVDEAPWPEFKQKQPGLDFGVQVQDSELFDYVREVEPLLQVLVGQSIVKARNELQEESEQEEKQRKLAGFQKKRNAELMVTQRLETQRKRKVEEVERRLLQHKVHLKQKKLTLQKLICHNQTKRSLTGLRSQILNDLQNQGLLRHDLYTNLRTSFQPWLYQQILSQIQTSESLTNAAKQLCKTQQKQLTHKHSQNIQKQTQRRKQILDQRQKQRLQNQQKKLRKAIRRHRKTLNASRLDNDSKLFQLTSKGQKVQSLQKCQISDSQVRPRNVVYVSGGVFVHLLEILDGLAELKVNVTDEQVEELLVRVLGEMGVEVPVVETMREEIKALETEMRENFGGFYRRREEVVNQLVGKAKVINSQLLRVCEKNVDKTALQRLLRAVFNIYFTQAVPQQKPITKQPSSSDEPPSDSPSPPPPAPQQPKITLTQRQKQRLAIRQNLTLNFQPTPFTPPSEIIRVRHPLQKPEELEQDPEYIEVYDGEGWERLKTKYNKKQQTQPPQALTFNFTGFQRAYVYDQISNQVFQQWVYMLLHKLNVHVQEDEYERVMEKQNRVFEELGKVVSRNNEIPIYDFEYQE